MGYAEDGKAIMNNLVLGTGVGASATGLYYLAKQLRKRFEEQLAKGAPDAPDYNEVATETPDLATIQPKLAFDAYTVATPLATGAAGAILAAALSDNKTKKRNAILGGLTGAGVGAGLNTKPVHEAIAKSLPTGWFPYLNPFGESGGRNHAYGGWKTMANVGGAAAGLAGGKALYDLSVAPQIEAEKKRKNYEAVEGARKQYFDELLSEKDDKKKEKRSSVNDLLDGAYAAYAEKEAGVGDVWNAIWTKGNYNPLAWLTSAYRAPVDLMSLGAAGAFTGAGLLGGKYMYDKTMAASKSKNLAKALAAKERMKDALPPWVDPQELAQIKEVASTNADQGV